MFILCSEESKKINFEIYHSNFQLRIVDSAHCSCTCLYFSLQKTHTFSLDSTFKTLTSGRKVNKAITNRTSE